MNEPSRLSGPAVPESHLRPARPEKVTTDFDWLVYSDATFAGLSVLIPVPFLDALMEEYFRRAMLLSRGDAMVFIERPISLGLLIATAALLTLMALPSIKKAREQAFQEEG